MLALIIVSWLVAVAVATFIGAHKGNAGKGFLLGLLLSWLGVMLVASMHKTQAAERTAQAADEHPGYVDGLKDGE